MEISTFISAWIATLVLSFATLRSGKSGKAGKENKDFKGVLIKVDKSPPEASNPCAGSKIELENEKCSSLLLPQAGADVSVGYQGDLDVGDVVPLIEPFWTASMCPVNVHWHLGTEHRSEGQYDEKIGKGPGRHDSEISHSEVRQGLQCGYYDKHDPKFTTEYDWKHCEGMVVGETYEVHWPHSLGGDCGTVNQYQSSFYDGVFCNADRLDFTKLHEQVGVQAQVFTVVNDESYYYPDLMRGMIVDPTFNMGTEITKYVGSTTGTSRDNKICSQYSPITWHVDRRCHMISASSFDKMCHEMMSQRDDMSDDLEPHGARELVKDEYVADNIVHNS